MKLENIKDSYFNWIKNNTAFTKVLNDSVELSSPFLDSLNENIKIYIVPESNSFKITDDGYTLWSLESMGISFRKGSQREKMLKHILDRYRVSLNEKSNDIFIMTDQENLGQSIHVLLQSVLSVSDLLKIDKRSVKNLFFDEVNNYFNKHQDFFDPFPDFEIQGKSKLMHRFDYLINVKNKQKKLVRLVNYLDQTQLERTLLCWQDTSEQRTRKYKENLGMVALINDSEREINDKYKQAFIEYGIEPIGFSNKEAVKSSLSYVS